MSNPQITQTKSEYCSLCETCIACGALCGFTTYVLAGLAGYGTVNLLF